MTLLLLAVSCGDNAESALAVVITSPGERETVVQGTEAFFRATATDQSAKRLSTLLVDWSSDIDGILIGTEDINVDSQSKSAELTLRLEEGMETAGGHELTVTIVNSNGDGAFGTADLNVDENSAPSCAWLAPSTGAHLVAGEPTTAKIEAYDTEDLPEEIILTFEASFEAQFPTHPDQLGFATFEIPALPADSDHNAQLCCTDTAGAFDCTFITFDVKD